MPSKHPDLPATSPRWIQLLTWYAPRYVDKHFSAVRLLGDPPDTADPRPILVYLNHPSWWDPMAIMLLISKYFMHRTGYGPIDAAGLAKYRFMEKLGFFGIDPESRAGAAKFLRIGRAVLSTPNQTFWVTAEGHFTDPRKRPVTLRPGVAHLARRVPSEVGAVGVPLAIEYGFGQEKQPEMRLAFGQAVPLGDRSRSVEQWDALLTDRLADTMDRLAAAAIAPAGSENAAAWTELSAGRRGVGGVYDWWRAAAARLRGERFDPAHFDRLGRAGRNP